MKSKQIQKIGSSKKARQRRRRRNNKNFRCKKNKKKKRHYAVDVDVLWRQVDSHIHFTTLEQSNAVFYCIEMPMLWFVSSTMGQCTENSAFCMFILNCVYLFFVCNSSTFFPIRCCGCLCRHFDGNTKVDHGMQWSSEKERRKRKKKK